MSTLHDLDPTAVGTTKKGQESHPSDDAPAHAVDATPAKKEPPPEKPETIIIRAFVILSFWAIILLLGLPIWWRTTTIYRARLPLDQMMDWADGRVKSLSTVEIIALTKPFRHVDQSFHCEYP